MNADILKYLLKIIIPLYSRMIEDDKRDFLSIPLEK
jgi:hypothetical protein